MPDVNILKYATNRQGLEYDKWGMIVEPERENICLWSSDLTNYNWNRLGNIVTTYSEPGLDGDISATLLSGENDADYQYIYKSYTVPPNTLPLTHRFFIKAVNPSNGYISIKVAIGRIDGNDRINMCADLVSGYYWIAFSAGSIGALIEFNLIGDWYEILIQYNNKNNTSLHHSVYPALAKEIDGEADATATGEMTVGNIELHLGKTIEEVRGTSPIFTEGTAETAAPQTTSYNSRNHANYNGLYYLEFYPFTAPLDDVDKELVTLAANNNHMMELIAGALSELTSTDADGGVSKQSVTWTPDTLVRLAMIYSAPDDLFSIAVDGINGTDFAFSGTFLDGLGFLSLLKDILRPTLIRRFTIERGGHYQDLRDRAKFLTAGSPYDPLEDHPDWYLLDPPGPSSARILGDTISVDTSGLPEKGMAFGSDKHEDVEVKGIFRFEPSADAAKSFPLAVRMQDNDAGMIIIRVFYDDVELFERVGTVFTKIHTAVGAGVGIKDTEVKLKVIGDTITFTVQGVEYESPVKATILTPGRVGLSLRGWDTALLGSLMLTNFRVEGFPVKLLQDTFTGADGIDITSRSPDIDLAGNGWVVEGGTTWLIQNNKAESSDPKTHFISDVGETDVSVSADVVTTATASNMVLRYTDPDNNIFANLHFPSQRIVLYSRVAGVNINVGETPVTVTAGQSYRLEFRITGTFIEYFINGVFIISGTVTDHVTATRHGYKHADPIEIETVDNFVITRMK